MSENIYRKARIPLHYPLVFLLNVLLIIALEVLLLYPTPAPLTEALLREQAPAYSAAVIRNHTESADITWYLVEREPEVLEVVPLRKHIFLQTRGRLLTDQITPVSAEAAHVEITTRAGIGGSTVMIGTEVEPWADEHSDYPLQMRSKYSRSHLGANGGAAVGGKYVLLGIALSLLEGILWHKIRGNI